MKILHLNSNKIWRGGEQQVNHMLNYRSDKFDKYLFCPENSELEKRNTHLKEKIFTYKKSLGINISAARALKKICGQLGFDLLHLHDSHAINTYIIANLLGMNVPAVIHRHVNFSVHSKWKYRYNKIQRIICVSDEVKKTMMAVVKEKELSVVHPGIDVQKFRSTEIKNYLHKELNIPGEKKIVGIVTSLEKEKNVAEFVAVANKMLGQRKDIVFVIIGDGKQKEKFANLKLYTDIYFLGFRNDIPEILSDLDLFLFTSLNEGFGLVLLESMAAKVPVVTTNAGSIKDIITNARNGMIYESGNINDAIEKIELVLSDENLSDAINKNAFEYVQQFDVTLMNQKIEEIYSSIII
ncbi:MAG: glycosyltransferase [Bacteroidota bacterium]|nr:glycosyltransferase [Bacteroidota bacterium]